MIKLGQILDTNLPYKQGLSRVFLGQNKMKLRTGANNFVIVPIHAPSYHDDWLICKPLFQIQRKLLGRRLPPL